jgi:hypothetical protein
MQNILSGTVALVFCHDLLFIALRYTYVSLTFSPQFISLYLTSLYLAEFLDDFHQTVTSPDLTLS